MSGIGYIDIRTPGSVTAPSSLALTVSSALTAAMQTFAASDVIYLPSLKAILFSNGVDFQYHYIDAAQYLNGPIAPGTAPSDVSTAAQATCVLTFSSNPNDGDLIQVGRPGSAPGNGYIMFKNTLDATLASDQVKIAGSLGATAINLGKLINNTGINGTDFVSFKMSLGGATPGFDTVNDVTTTTGATTSTFKAVTYGIVGNGYISRAVVGAGRIDFATAYFTGGTAGTQSKNPVFPGSGTYQHFIARYRAADAMQTAASPVATVQNGGNFDMTVGTFGTPPTRDGITHTRIFRSTLNGGSQFYKEEDTTGSSYTDALPDSVIIGDFANLYDGSKFRPYAGGYPPRFSCGTIYKGALYATGAISRGVYSHGTVTATLASKSVTFSAGTALKSDIIGNLLRAEGTIDYVIVDFVESTRVATLNRAYEGPGGAGLSYTLTDARDPTEIYWTVTGLFNQWPVKNSVKGVTTTDPLGCVGLRAIGGVMYAWTRTGVWRLIGSPDAIPVITPQSDGMGAWSQNSIVEVEGVMYWLGPDGVVAWDGVNAPRNLSNPPPGQKGKPRGINETVGRVNEDQARQIVAVYNHSENLVRWFVPLDGSPWNTHQIVLDMQTMSFSLDVGPEAATWAASVPGADGKDKTVVGDAFGDLWQVEVGQSDGAYGFDPVATVSSYSAVTNTITTSSTAFPTTGDALKGVSGIHVTAFGERQTFSIVSNTSGALTLLSPLTTTPVAGDKIIVGGIEMVLKSCKYDYGRPDLLKSISSITVAFTPQDEDVRPQLWCGGSKDDDDPDVFMLRSSASADFADLSDTDGEKLYWLRKGKGRRVQYEILALCPGFDVEILAVVINNPIASAVGA